MNSRVTGFGIAVLAFVAYVNISLAPSLATILSWVLAGMAIRFITLPGPEEAPKRRSGSLIQMPLILGFLLLFLDEYSAGKAPGSEQFKSLSTILLSAWVALKIWDSQLNRRRDLEEARQSILTDSQPNPEVEPLQT